ncbi:CAP domain-containing protein [Bacillus sp. ISL-46]|uniref:CAP domain-containing protein n=1 Tax=Bacillus sp. ISL-46 TaxID=2819129 RepID=UPI0027DFE511|nr:CAP domain-containing protein [Bacillus sp. ISL-46]
MIKKPVGLLLTAVLTMGLAACNNNDNKEINDQGSNRIGMNTNNRNNTPYMDVRNGRDDGIDHNGPLTEDYTNNNNSESDSDVNFYNNKRKNKKNYNNNDDMISAYQTNLNSNQYPHTRAVLIRDAKYQFIRLDPRLGNLALQQIQPYIQQQRPNEQAPVQQQPAPIQQQPAPIQQQPAPKQQRPAPPQAQPAPKQPAATQNNAPATGTVSQYVQQVIDLTNAQRSKNGLPALKADTQLNSVAQKKSLDMQQKNYFSHTSPTYGSPFDMMRDFGVTYKSAGENIAQGQRTPQEVVTAWMNSEGHRKNILSSNFTHIGVGFEATGKHWTQMFIGK